MKSRGHAGAIRMFSSARPVSRSAVLITTGLYAAAIVAGTFALKDDNSGLHDQCHCADDAQKVMKTP